MTQPRNIAVLVGSLRRESFSRKIAVALADLAPESLKLQIVEIGDLPLYNQDDEPTPPAEWTRFRNEIKAADGVLFVTPEYNRSLPAVLKNAIDVGSRPYGASAWDGKPGAVISQSPGALGGFGANHALRQSLVFLNVPALQREAYIGGSAEVFTPEGKIAKPETETFLKSYIDAYAEWVERHLPTQALAEVVR